MRTIHLAALVMGALTLSAGNTAAQTSPILNIVEVQKLVASETPADHARLARTSPRSRSNRPERPSVIRRWHGRLAGIRAVSSART